MTRFDVVHLGLIWLGVWPIATGLVVLADAVAPDAPVAAMTAVMALMLVPCIRFVVAPLAGRVARRLARAPSG